MKTTLIALALAASTLAAQATNWIEFPATDASEGAASLDSEVAADRTGAGTLWQYCEAATTRCRRAFMQVSAQECRQGFGYLYFSTLNGKALGTRNEFVLGTPVTVADAMAEYMCKFIPTTTARKAK